jgi:putative ABC transport system substrate-binding protein
MIPMGTGQLAIGIGRRQFIGALGGAAAWPLAARAQQAALPVVGLLTMANAGPSSAATLAGLRRGLSDAGYVEGQNVTIEYRWAEAQYDRLPALAAELVQRQVAVIVATVSSAPALAAKALTSTIPIVFTTGGDPVQQGLVASLNRPGGNVTGVFLLSDVLEGKRLGLLHETVPTAALITVLLHPGNPAFETQLKDVEQTAAAAGQKLQILHATNELEVDVAFAEAAKSGAGAMLVASDPTNFASREHLIAAAAQYAIPAIYQSREYAESGGLMSYGTSFVAAWRQAGLFAGQILKGAKPADLPVQQSTKFEFLINLKTAKTLGLTIPSGVLAIADEVVE